jgi:hypothetical protein
MNWETALAAADGAVAGVFDRQLVSIRPKTQGTSVNGPAIDDATRSAFERLVSIEMEPDMLMSSRRPAGDPAAGRQQGVSYEAVMTADVAGWPWLPRRGDMIVDGERKWTVAAVQDGAGRPAFYLNRAG